MRNETNTFDKKKRGTNNYNTKDNNTTTLKYFYIFYTRLQRINTLTVECLSGITEHSWCIYYILGTNMGIVKKGASCMHLNKLLSKQWRQNSKYTLERWDWQTAKQI